MDRRLSIGIKSNDKKNANIDINKNYINDEIEQLIKEQKIIIVCEDISNEALNQNRIERADNWLDVKKLLLKK